MPTALQLLIRPAKAGDLPALLEVERASFPSPWSAKGFEAEIKAAHSHLWVAVSLCRCHTVKGYVCFHWLVDEVYIVNLTVAPGSRRQGVASALLGLVLQWCRRRGGRMAGLEVRATNKAAVALYRNFGFEVSHVRPDYYGQGTPALVMTRPI